MTAIAARSRSSATTGRQWAARGDGPTARTGRRAFRMTRSAVEPRNASRKALAPPRPTTISSAFALAAQAPISFAAPPSLTRRPTRTLRGSAFRRCRSSSASAASASRTAPRCSARGRPFGTTCTSITLASSAMGSKASRRRTRSEAGVRSTAAITERNAAGSTEPLRLDARRLASRRFTLLPRLHSKNERRETRLEREISRGLGLIEDLSDLEAPLAGRDLPLDDVALAVTEDRRPDRSQNRDLLRGHIGGGRIDEGHLEVLPRVEIAQPHAGVHRDDVARDLRRLDDPRAANLVLKTGQVSEVLPTLQQGGPENVVQPVIVGARQKKLRVGHGSSSPGRCRPDSISMPRVHPGGSLAGNDCSRVRSIARSLGAASAAAARARAGELARCSST